MKTLTKTCSLCSRSAPDGAAAYHASQITEGLHNWPIPEHTAQALHNYVVHHIPPGGFLYAVLTNDLSGAVGRADHENAAALKDIVGLIYNHIPGPAWKTPAHVAAWLDPPLRAAAEGEA